MANSNVDVASQALARLGEPSISSFSEDSDTAERVGQLYEPTILQLLGSHNWTFAQRRKKLEKDGAALPVNQWKYGYLLPPLRTDRIGKPLSVFASDELQARKIFDFEFEDRWLYTNRETIVIEYIYRVPESRWPGYFHTLAIEAIAATLALPVTENASKEELHRTIAYGTPSQHGRGGLFRTATEADATGNPTRGLLDDDDPIWSVRFGGRF